MYDILHVNEDLIDIDILPLQISEAVEDLEPKVEIETEGQVKEGKAASKSALHLSKATAITLLVVGVLAFITVVAVFTFKCVEWSPRRRYNRIDFLMNDVDD